MRQKTGKILSPAATRDNSTPILEISTTKIRRDSRHCMSRQSAVGNCWNKEQNELGDLSLVSRCHRHTIRRPATSSNPVIPAILCSPQCPDIKHKEVKYTRPSPRRPGFCTMKVPNAALVVLEIAALVAPSFATVKLSRFAKVLLHSYLHTLTLLQSAYWRTALCQEQAHH